MSQFSDFLHLGNPSGCQSNYLTFALLMVDIPKESLYKYIWLRHQRKTVMRHPLWTIPADDYISCLLSCEANKFVTSFDSIRSKLVSQARPFVAYFHFLRVRSFSSPVKICVWNFEYFTPGTNFWRKFPLCVGFIRGTKKLYKRE